MTTDGDQLPAVETFSSGVHGTVAGKRGQLRRLGDRALDGWLVASGAGRRLDDLAAATPERDVLVIAVGSAQSPLLASALGELRRTRHRLRIRSGSVEQLGGGKFQNANRLLEGQQPADWTLLVDDDIVLPQRFLDRFVGVAEALGFDLAQPAQTLASHAAWSSARRQPFVLARRTNFVEIGPVTAFSRRAAHELLPFPDLRMGWGLDLHWSALAAERGWRLGVVDASPVKHEARAVGRSYATDDAGAEAQRFLAGKPYLHASDAGRTLEAYRRLP